MTGLSDLSFFLRLRFFSSLGSEGARPGTTRSREGMPLEEEVPFVWGMPPSSSRLKAAGVAVPRAWGGRYAPAGLVGVKMFPFGSD